MAQPPAAAPSDGGEAAAFLPILSPEADDQTGPAPSAAASSPQARQRRPAAGGDGDDGHAPRGTPEEAQRVLAGLPAGSLGQAVALPAPRIVRDFRLSAALERKVALGRGCWGERNWIGISGGAWSATWGRGKIVPGGQDAQLLTDTKSTFVDTRYLLATDDPEPAHIMVRTEGWRTGPPEVLTRLLDPVEGDGVDPGEYRFRLFVRLETGDERYRWVNEGMWIGSGVRRGLEVIYDGYRLL